MKYLKTFNEGLSDLTYLEILDFCEENLAYLMDDGFNVSVQSDRFMDEIETIEVDGIKNIHYLIGSNIAKLLDRKLKNQ
jgi:hypothetical protein